MFSARKDILHCENCEVRSRRMDEQLAGEIDVLRSIFENELNVEDGDDGWGPLKRSVL